MVLINFEAHSSSCVLTAKRTMVCGFQSHALLLTRYSHREGGQGADSGILQPHKCMGTRA